MCLNLNVKSAIVLMWGNGYIYRKGLGNLDEYLNVFYVRIYLFS